VLDIYESLLRNMTFSQGRDGHDDAEVRKTQSEVKWRVEHAQILVSQSSLGCSASRERLEMAGLTWGLWMQRLEDIERMGRLGIIASFQPTHGASYSTYWLHIFSAMMADLSGLSTATSDMGYAEKRIGSERIKGAYAWRSLLE
jgi:predicted amidohydrolase YtcJ